MSNKENIEKLSNLREQALAILKQYNELATQENYDTRLGVISASVNSDQFRDYDDDPEGEKEVVMPEDLQSYMYDNGVQPYWATTFPGLNGTNTFSWQPSGLNC